MMLMMMMVGKCLRFLGWENGFCLIQVPSPHSGEGKGERGSRGERDNLMLLGSGYL